MISYCPVSGCSCASAEAVSAAVSSAPLSYRDLVRGLVQGLQTCAACRAACLQPSTVRIALPHAVCLHVAVVPTLQ